MLAGNGTGHHAKQHKSVAKLAGFAKVKIYLKLADSVLMVK